MRAAERAADLTRQLLAYAGKGRFVMRTLDLSDLVREISGLVQTSLSQARAAPAAACPTICRASMPTPGRCNRSS